MQCWICPEKKKKRNVCFNVASGFNFWVSLLFTTKSSQTPKKHKELHRIRFNANVQPSNTAGFINQFLILVFLYPTGRCTGIQVIVWQVCDRSMRHPPASGTKQAKQVQVFASVLFLQGSSRWLLALKHTDSTSNKVKGSAPLHFLKWFSCCTNFCSHGDLFDSWSGHLQRWGLWYVLHIWMFSCFTQLGSPALQ